MSNKETQNFLGIDWGLKKIGLAIANSEIKIAFPFQVVNSLEEVIDVIDKEMIDVVVLGEPLKFISSEDLNQDFIDFYQKLKKELFIRKKKFFLFDERLTSRQADFLIANKKVKTEQDAVAAMLILEGFFEKNF